MPFFTSISFTLKPLLQEIVQIFFKNKDLSNFQNLITTYPFPRTLFPTIFLKTVLTLFSKPNPKQFPKPHYHIPFFHPYFLYLKKIYIKSRSKNSLPYTLFHLYIKSHFKTSLPYALFYLYKFYSKTPFTRNCTNIF